MNKPRFYILLIVLSVLLVTLACNFTASIAKINDAYLAFDQQGTQKTSIYSPTDQFYAIISLSNAPDDTTIKAVWKGEKDVELVENEITSGDGILYFNAGGDWSVGKYKVDIYLNGELDRTLEFEVKYLEGGVIKTAIPTPDSAIALIESAYLLRNENGTERVSIFFPQDTFYAIIEMPDAPADTVAKAVWYAVYAEGLALNSELDQAEILGTGTITFNLTATEPWLTGKYKVEIYANAEPALDKKISSPINIQGLVADYL